MPLMTKAAYPSLISGTTTPMVKLRCLRKERATKLGRRLRCRAAARMRSLVACGMESAAGERLITRDTVAGESPRCSARAFWLSGPPGCGVRLRFVRDIAAQSGTSASLRASGRARTNLLDTFGRTVIHGGQDRGINRFSKAFQAAL